MNLEFSELETQEEPQPTELCNRMNDCLRLKGLEVDAGTGRADEALPGQADRVPGAGVDGEDDELRNVWPVVFPGGWQIATPNVPVS